MIINELMFVFLMVECGVCILLVIPYGNALCQKVVQAVSQAMGPSSPLTFPLHVLLSLLLLLFVSNVHTVYKYNNMLHSEDGGVQLTDGLRIRVLVAQRDTYLSGFSLFLCLLLRLVYQSLARNLKLERSLVAMEKQAQGAALGYKSMLEENEKSNSQLAKLKSMVEKKGDISIDELLDENSSLELEVKTLKKTVEDQKVQVSLVKKQAASQSESFMKLMEEKTELETTIALGGKTEDSPTKSSDEDDKKLIVALKEENASLKDQIKDFDFMFDNKKKKDN